MGCFCVCQQMPSYSEGTGPLKNVRNRLTSASVKYDQHYPPASNVEDSANYRHPMLLVVAVFFQVSRIVYLSIVDILFHMVWGRKSDQRPLPLPLPLELPPPLPLPLPLPLASGDLLSVFLS